MSSKSITPVTATSTSLKDRPTLRLLLRAAWVGVMVYVVYILVAGVNQYSGGLFSGNLIGQIARIGFSLFSYSTINIFADVYILLGYLGLGVTLFLRRSDDWFAIFLSVVIITFGTMVTNFGNQLAADASSRYFFSPIVMMGQAGIVLLGWLYPDGRLVPHWLKYVLPVFLVSSVLMYWPDSPVYGPKLDLAVWVGISLFWYFATVAVMVYRYKRMTNLNQRQQIHWMFLGMLGPLAWYIIFNITQLLLPALQTEGTVANIIFQLSMPLFSIVLFLMFPACVTIAIARYKLFDVDFLINRALVYGALTAALVCVFGLVLIVANSVFNAVTAGEQTTLGVLLSALAAGALFQPTRKALQRFVDRTFYRIKIDYLKTPVKAKYQSTSDTQTQAPILFSSYRDLALIGKGGMAEIYRAEHPTLARTVAIKVLLANLAEDEQFRKRFMREAETVSRLEHRNIVKLFDYGTENGLYYMVMEYLDGANLSALLKQRGRIPLDDILPILKDVAAALDYAHSFGLIHRDVKPSNVMLDSGLDAPRAVLTDFGIAKISGAYTKITASAVLGTFDYIAPEQIQAAADVDCRADIYALGVMTYQFLTGVLPFQRPGVGALLMAHLSAPPPDAGELAPSLPRHTSTAIQKAMSKKPADRFASAGEFVAALE